MMHQTDFTLSFPNRKIKYLPLSLFPSGQNLPLFTGVPDVIVNPFSHDVVISVDVPQYTQLSLFDNEVQHA